MRRFALAGSAVLSIALAACDNDPASTAVYTAAPRLDLVTVAANPHNVLSAVVVVAVADADSARVVVRRAGIMGAPEAVTPAVSVTEQRATIPVLGLFATTDYTLIVLAYGPGGVAVSNEIAFTTGALPADLPSYVASGSDPSTGFVAVASGTGKYALVIDNTGRVVWYRYFPNGAGLNFMVQPTGHYALRPPTPAAGDIEPWIELDALGNITRELTCADGLQPRPHDLILEAQGSFWILCDETRSMDLSQLGGVANAHVTGTVIQHIGPAGDVLFAWSAFDHFDITDLDAADRTGANVNWTHGNAIDLDPDGNLIASFRSLNEITRIDTRTGDVLWRLGGLRNQFTFVDTPLPAFARQHGVRMAAGGWLSLLDNVGNPAESRAERYLLDAGTRTARLVQSYGSVPGVRTDIGGSVQQLDAERALVSFGTAGRVEEYDASDRVLWQIEGNAGYVFRAQRIHSLYQPGIGDPR